jgi:hypothetical protein
MDIKLTQECHKQEKSRCDREGYFQQIGSIKKKTLDENNSVSR